jgi:hypothetical protein
MYNTEVVCTYNTESIFLETDELTEHDKEFIMDAVYRQELLNIFDIEDYDDMKIEIAMMSLYENIKGCKELEKSIKKIAGDLYSLDGIIGLMLLFSYDYMYLTHVCVSEFLKTGKVSETNIFNLEKKIFCN